MRLELYRTELSSRIATVFQVPKVILAATNPKLTEIVAVGEVVEIPGYTVRAMSLNKKNFTDPFLRERIELLNPTGTDVVWQSQFPVKYKQNRIDQHKAYTSLRLQQDLADLLEIFPFFKVNEIGYSYLGKPIYEIKMGQGKKKVHINASVHANEWITSLVLMNWFQEFLLALTHGEKIGSYSALELFLNSEISLVPMANPDGVDLVVNGAPDEWLSILRTMNKGSDDFSQWKANIRGVDLNNQFPANWEIEKFRKLPKGSAARDFPGYAPLTEPEVIALVTLTEREQFDRVLSLHTQGKEFYWGYEDLQPEESILLAEEFARRSGYQAIKNVDSHAGYKDWFIQEYGKPGFTIELGYGENPLPLSQFKEIYHDVCDLLSAAVF